MKSRELAQRIPLIIVWYFEVSKSKHHSTHSFLWTSFMYPSFFHSVICSQNLMGLQHPPNYIFLTAGNNKFIKAIVLLSGTVVHRIHVSLHQILPRKLALLNILNSVSVRAKILKAKFQGQTGAHFNQQNDSLCRVFIYLYFPNILFGILMTSEYIYKINRTLMNTGQTFIYLVKKIGFSQLLIPKLFIHLHQEKKRRKDVQQLIKDINMFQMLP